MSLPNDKTPFVVVGLGNPGLQYEKTRHNIGFMVMDDLAKRHYAAWKYQAAMESQVTKIEVSGRILYLVKPETFMNLSGQAVRRMLDYYRLGHKNLVVAVDDCDLPFGQLRLKLTGGSGGHNGLKDIEQCVGSQDYIRLRIGIGRPLEDPIPLADYVLSRFNEAESEKLPALIESSTKIIERLASEDAERVMGDVNMRRTIDERKETL